MHNINDELLAELKSIHKELARPFKQKWTSERKFRQLTIELASIDQRFNFNFYIRQNELHENDFSCGISLIRQGENPLTLARYNGSSHVHVNKLDGQRFEFQCHIHEANSQCLKVAKKIEDHAHATDRYNNLAGAIQCIFEDYHIIDLNLGQLIKQGGLFDEI
ncbi:hypothetical protein KTJ20_10030 [Acinetobacter ursingii]|uniref:hypothetical protein n=1 Tax=Acinetobacter ursingii TaxID=108980 RepID=UPI0021CDD67F|nr:hypothetical protein [Acinetobacter ursingii]MCU4589088.1 hypothetical protein [Acinetobacter ursingii]